MADPAGADPADAIAEAWQRERPGTPVESIGIVTRIWRLARLFADDRRHVLASAGVDAALLDLLGALRRSGPPYRLTTRELSQRIGVTPGAISQRLTRAERDGYITRSPVGGPSRAVAVTLTEKGHELVERLVDRVLGRETSLLAGLPPSDREQLARLLKQLHRTVSAEIRRPTTPQQS
jgi:DNA-binding MarR family transcriptional regulator